MRKYRCPNCGSTDLESADGYGYIYFVCQKCGHEFTKEDEEP